MVCSIPGSRAGVPFVAFQSPTGRFLAPTAAPQVPPYTPPRSSSLRAVPRPPTGLYYFQPEYAHPSFLPRNPFLLIFFSLSLRASPQCHGKRERRPIERSRAARLALRAAPNARAAAGPRSTQVPWPTGHGRVIRKRQKARAEPPFPPTRPAADCISKASSPAIG